MRRPSQIASVLLALASASAFSGCGGTRAPAYVLDRLYFGLSAPSGPISDDQFQAFVDQEVTPRFPDGLTRLNAQGQWRGKSGEIVKESSIVLELAFPNTPENRERIEAIVAAYRQRFAQESVMVVESSPDVRF